MLEGEMQLISKELWTIASQLQAVLKKVLTSKCEREGLDESVHI